jgi:hypothetical protein
VLYVITMDLIKHCVSPLGLFGEKKKKIESHRGELYFLEWSTQSLYRFIFTIKELFKHYMNFWKFYAATERVTVDEIQESAVRCVQMISAVLTETHKYVSQ